MNDVESPQPVTDAANFLEGERQRSELQWKLDAALGENAAFRTVLQNIPGVVEGVEDAIGGVYISTGLEARAALGGAVARQALTAEVTKGFAALVGEYAQEHAPELEAAANDELQSRPDLQADVKEAARKQVLEQMVGEKTTAQAMELAREQKLESARQEAFGGLGVDMESLAPETKVTVKLGEYHDGSQSTAFVSRTLEFITHGDGEFEVAVDSGAESEGDTSYASGELVWLGRQITRKGESQFRPTIRAGAELCVDRDNEEPGHEIVAGGCVVGMSIDDKPLRQLQELAPNAPATELVVDNTRAMFEDGPERDIDSEGIFRDFNSNNYVDITKLPYATQIELWLGASDYVQEGNGTRIEHRIRASAIGDGRFYIANLDDLIPPDAVDVNHPLRRNATFGLRLCIRTHRGYLEALTSDAPLHVVGGVYSSGDGIYQGAFPLGRRLVLQNLVVGKKSARPIEDFSFEQ